jgi:hypothetical protein
VKNLYSIHGGEFVVGNFIEKNYKSVTLWIPSRDVGTDLLVTDANNERPVSLQVKYSRDYLETNDPEYSSRIRAGGWWTLGRDKIAESRADHWVFVLKGFGMKLPDFVVIEPSELLKRLDRIHGKTKTIQSYLWITRNNRCWEIRGLKNQERLEIAEDHYQNPDRDFSDYLNNWSCVKAINGK